MRIALAFMAIVHLSLLGGCGKAPEDEPEPEVPEKVGEVREIVLPSSASISVEAGDEGEARIVVTIPEGQPGAGTYTSTSSHLVDLAQDTIRTLGDPQAEATIEVDDAGEILSISHSVTLK